MSSTGPSAGSREQRRARLEQVALELFRRRGFDHVTVEDICAEAGVAPATFYRYFGTKEEVVFAYRDGFTAALHRALEAGAGAGDTARLPVVLREFATFLESQQDLLAVRDQIVVGHPRLMQRTLLVQRELEAELATGLATMRGATVPDAAALMEAGVGLLLIRMAFRSWRAEGGGSLLAAMHEASRQLREVAARSVIGTE